MLVKAIKTHLIDSCGPRYHGVPVFTLDPLSAILSGTLLTHGAILKSKHVGGYTDVSWTRREAAEHPDWIVAMLTHTLSLLTAVRSHLG